MAKYIDAGEKVNIQVYDEENEEYAIKTMTIEECLDSYTDEGCPEAADVQEVKHGYNNLADYPLFFECSICGFKCYDMGRCTSDFDYCPNCGAKMDGGSENETD